MIVNIRRIAKKSTYTIGRLYVNGEYVCDTCEDKDRGLTQSMTESEIKRIKVYGQTAIPIGEYEIVQSVAFKGKAWSKKYGCKMPLIKGVKGYSGVYIHCGNSADDSLGCPLVGENKVVGKVINSQKTFYRLMDNYFVPAWNRKESIKLIIE